LVSVTSALGPKAITSSLAGESCSGTSLLRNHKIAKRSWLFESTRNSNGTMAGNDRRYRVFGAAEESSSVSDREEMIALDEEAAQLTGSQERAEWLCRKASARVEEFPVAHQTLMKPLPKSGTGFATWRSG